MCRTCRRARPTAAAPSRAHPCPRIYAPTHAPASVPTCVSANQAKRLLKELQAQAAAAEAARGLEAAMCRRPAGPGALKASLARAEAAASALSAAGGSPTALTEALLPLLQVRPEKGGCVCVWVGEEDVGGGV
jgi:hypothetical protein